MSIAAEAYDESYDEAYDESYDEGYEEAYRPSRITQVRPMAPPARPTDRPVTQAQLTMAIEGVNRNIRQTNSNVSSVNRGLTRVGRDVSTVRRQSTSSRRDIATLRDAVIIGPLLANSVGSANPTLSALLPMLLVGNVGTDAPAGASSSASGIFGGGDSSSLLLFALVLSGGFGDQDDLMSISPLGLVLGAALAQGVKDPARATQIEVLGGVLGTSPLGIVLLATLARPAPTDQPPGGGPTESAVPDVRDAGDNLEAAARLLEARGLAAGPTARVVSEAPLKEILGSSPENGSVVPLKTVVTINVSAGLIVPTVTKLTVAEAEQALDQAGFNSDVTVTDLRGDPDVVVKQDPEGGAFASAGDTVTLYVNQDRQSPTE